MKLWPSLLLALCLFVFFTSIGRGQLPSTVDISERRDTERINTELICSLSAFFSVDPSTLVDRRARLDGRGLMRCSNDQGFTTEQPILIDLEAELPAEYQREGEISVSGNSSAFVVPREISQLEDSYQVRLHSWNESESNPPHVILRGLTHDLVIEMRFTSPNREDRSIKVRDLSLRFDDSAPDLF